MTLAENNAESLVSQTYSFDDQHRAHDRVFGARIRLGTTPELNGIRTALERGSDEPYRQFAIELIDSEQHARRTGTARSRS